MTAHLTVEEAARWVSGVMDEAAADLAESHAATCAACAALLQAEARAEEQLALAVRAAPAPRRQRVPLMAGLAMAAALALVASATLWRPGTTAVHAPDAGGPSEELAFADEAYTPPLEALTSYALFALEPPRYEADLALEPNAAFVPLSP